MGLAEEDVGRCDVRPLLTTPNKQALAACYETPPTGFWRRQGVRMAGVGWHSGMLEQHVGDSVSLES